MFRHISHLALCFLALNLATIDGAPAAPVAPARIDHTWVGTYAFEECGSPDRGLHRRLKDHESIPSPQSMDYELTISRASDNMQAKLNVDGFQTLIRARGFARVNGNKCTIVFMSNYSDKDLSVAPTDRFKPNDILLTLEKQNRKLITYWGELKPLEIKHQKPGVYFHRVKP